MTNFEVVFAGEFSLFFVFFSVGVVFVVVIFAVVVFVFLKCANNINPLLLELSLPPIV